MLFFKLNKKAIVIVNEVKQPSTDFSGLLRQGSQLTTYTYRINGYHDNSCLLKVSSVYSLLLFQFLLQYLSAPDLSLNFFLPQAAYH